jgi:hypothetical protein
MLRIAFRNGNIAALAHICAATEFWNEVPT